MAKAGKNLISCVAFPLLLLAVSSAFCWGQIIVDHTCTDLSKVPNEWIGAAKGRFRIWYGHTSHGSQITTGMQMLSREPYTFSESGAGNTLSYHDAYESDLGAEGDLSWAAVTQSVLNSPANNRNMIMWSWCGGVSDNTEAGIRAYLQAMDALEKAYPNVTFVYMTGHLDGTGVTGNLHIRNNQIRDYCRANKKVLFDFADIESYDPDGKGYLALGANDNCDYSGGNWAVEWCASHPGQCPACEECAHSQCLNCYQKGKAFWWMMARLAGWEGTAEPAATPTLPAGPTPTPTPLEMAATPTPAAATPIPPPAGVRAWWGQNPWTGEVTHFPQSSEQWHRPYSVRFITRDQFAVTDEYALSFPKDFDPSKAYPVWIKFLPFYGSLAGIYHDTFATNYCDDNQVIYVGFAARAGEGAGYAGQEWLGDNPEYGMYYGPWIRNDLKELMNELMYLFRVEYFAFSGDSMGGYSAFRIAADIPRDYFGAVVASCPAIFFREWVAGRDLIVQKVREDGFRDRLVFVFVGTNDEPEMVQGCDMISSDAPSKEWWHYYRIEGAGHEGFFMIETEEGDQWGRVKPSVSSNPNLVWDRVQEWETAHPEIANTVLSPMQGWSPPSPTSDWYVPRDLVEWALVQRGLSTPPPVPTPTLTPSATPLPPGQTPTSTPPPPPTATPRPAVTPEITAMPTLGPPPSRVVVPLNQILDACQYLDPGDIPVDNFQPPAKAIYVATDGNDNNSGDSITAPFQHLHKAIDYANTYPDTPLTVYLRGGIHLYKDASDYEYQMIERSNLYISAYPNENVTIRPYYWPGNPSSWGNERAFEINGSYRNVTFDGLHFEGWSTIFTLGSPLSTPPLQNIVIKNVTASQFTRRSEEEGWFRMFLETGYLDDDVYGEGKVIFDNPETAHYQIEGLILSNLSIRDVDIAINVGDENDANVKGMRISSVDVINPTRQAGASVADAFAIVNSYNVLVDHCRLVNINDDGVDTKSFDVAVVNCYIEGTGRNAVKFWRNGELINSILYNVTDINDAAIIVEEGPFRMINSLLLGHPAGYAATFSYGTISTSSFEIVNSVFGKVQGSYTGSSNLTARNNRFFDLVGGVAVLSGSLEAENPDQLNALPNCSGNAMSTDQFVAPASGDFRLIPGSEWIDAGTSDAVLLPSFDYLGNPRIEGKTVDIGPIEYRVETGVDSWVLH